MVRLSPPLPQPEWDARPQKRQVADSGAPPRPVRPKPSKASSSTTPSSLRSSTTTARPSTKASTSTRRPSSSGSTTSTSSKAPLPTEKTAADYYVRQLPLLAQAKGLSLYAGHVPSTITSNPPQSFDSDAELYFLLARNRHIPKRERLLIWLNGGPGCSSFDGALMEIGPIRINVDGTPRQVENTAWNEYANVLFLDQPAGTGYSYVTKNDRVRELSQAADSVVIFLMNLYKLFPDLAQMDTYIAGESYAGQYVPYIAHAIVDSAFVSTPLKGLIIGNGWISPREQYPAYLTYVVRKGLVKSGTAAHRSLVAAVESCTAEMDSIAAASGGTDQGLVLVPECEKILPLITQATMKGTECMNMYDTTLWTDCSAEWPVDLPQVTKYLRRKDVVQALHAEAGAAVHPWEHCSDAVGSHFWTPNSAPAVKLLPALLDKMPILLYAGDRDAMCPGVGIEAMIDELEWAGAKGFNGSAREEWSVDGRPAGSWQTDRGLSYVEVFDASHMVPIDQPTAAHDMLLRFMGVDTLHSAGHAAKIPSRIGHETESLLGATRPDGSAIAPVVGEEEAEPQRELITEDGFNKEHERLYGPRRTMVLVILLFATAGAVWGFCRWRRSRRRERLRRLKGKGRARLSDEAGARLEEGISLRGSGDGGGYGRVERDGDEPAETVPIFDVGEEDENEDDIPRRKS